MLRDGEGEEGKSDRRLLFHSAEYHPSGQPQTDNKQGWGLVNLQQVLNLLKPTRVNFIDERNGLELDKKHQYLLEITDSSLPLRVTLVYTDFLGENLVNNLNLELLDNEQSYLVLTSQKARKIML